MNTVLYCALNQIKSISILLYPLMPNSIEKTFHALGLANDDIKLKNAESLNLLKPGSLIKKTDILFKKIDNDS